MTEGVCVRRIYVLYAFQVKIADSPRALIIFAKKKIRPCTKEPQIPGNLQRNWHLIEEASGCLPGPLRATWLITQPGTTGVEERGPRTGDELVAAGCGNWNPRESQHLVTRRHRAQKPWLPPKNPASCIPHPLSTHQKDSDVTCAYITPDDPNIGQRRWKTTAVSGIIEFHR